MMQDAAPSKILAEPASSQPADVMTTHQEPQAWLARISALYEQGETQTAIEEMASFRQHYPGHPVPDTLKQLLPGP
jgi:outer membrane protein assembly factor BamD (BamD/ComL family)